MPDDGGGHARDRVGLAGTRGHVVAADRHRDEPDVSPVGVEEREGRRLLRRRGVGHPARGVRQDVRASDGGDQRGGRGATTAEIDQRQTGRLRHHDGVPRRGAPIGLVADRIGVSERHVVRLRCDVAAACAACPAPSTPVRTPQTMASAARALSPCRVWRTHAPSLASLPSFHGAGVGAGRQQGAATPCGQRPCSPARRLSRGRTSAGDARRRTRPSTRRSPRRPP